MREKDGEVAGGAVRSRASVVVGVDLIEITLSSTMPYHSDTVREPQADWGLASLLASLLASDEVADVVIVEGSAGEGEAEEAGLSSLTGNHEKDCPVVSVYSHRSSLGGATRSTQGEVGFTAAICADVN